MSEASTFVDYYQLLGVATNADTLAIRQAFLQFAKEYHPDRGGSTEQMQLYTTAYRTLKSDSSRKAYDLLHEFHTTGSTAAQYVHHSAGPVRPADDLSDTEIDDFIDSIFAEYHSAPKPKQKLFTRLKNML